MKLSHIIVMTAMFALTASLVEAGPIRSAGKRVGTHVAKHTASCPVSKGVVSGAKHAAKGAAKGARVLAKHV